MKPDYHFPYQGVRGERSIWESFVSQTNYVAETRTVVLFAVEGSAIQVVLMRGAHEFAEYHDDIQQSLHTLDDVKWWLPYEKELPVMPRRTSDRRILRLATELTRQVWLAGQLALHTVAFPRRPAVIRGWFIRNWKPSTRGT